MFGLAVFVVGVIYLIVLLAVTISAYFWAARRGFSRAKCWLAAAGGFLVIYLPVFWDHVPTVVAHQYYCAKEAGFWEYKTVEQWKKENPGVAETLVENKTAVSVQNAYVLNQRFNWAIYERRFFPLNYMMREEWQVVDSKTNEVLARYVNFSASHERRQAGWSGWKMWLDSTYCASGEKSQDAFRNFRDNFRRAK